MAKRKFPVRAGYFRLTGFGDFGGISEPFSGGFMNERGMTARARGPMSDPTMPGEGKRDVNEHNVANELCKASSILRRALELAETLLVRVNGPVPSNAADGGQGQPGLLGDASVCRDLASAVCDRLDELARVIG